MARYAVVVGESFGTANQRTIFDTLAAADTLAEMYRDQYAGTDVHVEVVRLGETDTLRAALATREKFAPYRRSFDHLSMTERALAK